MFRAINSDNFAPFEKLRLKLPVVQGKPDNLAEVHLFTGVNGAGKTRILSVLSAVLGTGLHLQKRMRGGEPAMLSIYSDSQASFNMSATSSGASFAGGDVSVWNSSQQIPAFAYSGYAYVSDANVTAMGTVQRPDRNYCLSFNKPENSSQILLQAITNLLFEAAVDSLNVAADDKVHSRAARLVKSLEATLLEITGTKFQFKIEKFPQISLYAVWGGTKLPFDVLPDGLRAIIGWLVHALVMMDVWLQGKGDPTNTEAVFLLDEIESHLHPAWQRKILPAFQRLFPKAQIFVATHSPFVIASLNHGWIHSLKIEGGKVKNGEPIAASKGDSYISVVEDIMGVKEWFDPETENLLTEFRAARDGAYKPEITAEQREQAMGSARKLAMAISQRSMELEFMMGKELIQMDRQLANGAGKA